MRTVVSNRVAGVRADLSFLWLEITAKCNLSCSHCYADSGPQVDLYGSMGYDDWIRVIDESAEVGCRSVQFIGGEPTLHPRLPDLIDHASRRGHQFIEVFTNATRLDKVLLGCFQRNRARVATSFYSDDPAVHDRLTESPGSWQRTVAGIESVLAAGLPLRVGVTEMIRNPGQAQRAVAFLKTLGVERIKVDRERSVGRANLVHLDCEGERYEELCGECWKGKLCVTSSGDVYPCVFSRKTRLGDARLGLAAILGTATLAAFREKVHAQNPDDPKDDEDEDTQQQCNPLSTCNPDTCNPNAGNDLDCNPFNANCNPCNPCAPDGYSG